MNLKLLKIEELADALQVKESTLRTWIRRKMIPSQCIVKIGGAIRFRQNIVEEWLNNGSI